MSDQPDTSEHNHHWTRECLGISWVILAGVALLIPALWHGVHLGPFDLLSKYGLTKQSGVVVHNPSTADQVDALMPWTNVAWSQVHNGHLPLWNPYGALGTPLAFNWQSATFGIPALVGYLFPVSLATTVGILVTLIIAGTGTYWLGRIMGIGILGAAMMGSVFELSGSFVGWLGWPHASVMSWAGWLFASILLILRQSHRLRSISILAIAAALAFYAGQPEILVLLFTGLAVFLLLVCVQIGRINGFASLKRPTIDFGIACITAAALAAPIALPGFEIIRSSARGTTGSSAALPLRDMTFLMAQGYDGLPIAGSFTLKHAQYYPESAAYIGVIALILAVVAVCVRRRRPVVLAFGVVVVAMICIALISPLTHVLGELPFVGSVAWHRSLLVMSFAIAVLAGVGLDIVARSLKRSLWIWVGIGFATAGMAIVVLFLGSGIGVTEAQRSIRIRSLIWPSLAVFLGIVIVGATALLLSRRTSDKSSPLESSDDTHSISQNSMHFFNPAKSASVALLVLETFLLIVAGAPIWSSSATYYPVRPAVAELQHIIGSSTVGIGGGTCYHMGIVPNANDSYGIHEFDVYDPAVPSSFYSEWTARTKESPGIQGIYIFCPLIKSASTARQYGVSYILEPIGKSGPRGTRRVARVGDEVIYRVPQVGEATLTPLLPNNSLPSEGSVGKPIEVTHPTPSIWKMKTSGTSPQVIRLHLAYYPGWHATMDGKPLELEQYSGLMMQAKIPAGNHIVELHYWPSSFTLGIIFAAVAICFLLTAGIIGMLRLRRTRKSENTSIH